MHQPDALRQLRSIQDGLRVGIEELLARRDYARVEDILRALDRLLDPLIARSATAPARPVVDKPATGA